MVHGISSVRARRIGPVEKWGDFCFGAMCFEWCVVGKSGVIIGHDRPPPP